MAPSQCQNPGEQGEDTDMKRLTSLAIALLVVLSLGGGTTSAKKPVTEFDVHVGDAFILGIGLPAVDIAGASNGDTIELLFTGRIDVKHSRAEGDGGFRHFDKGGKLVDFGTLTARHLISFLDLGPAAGFPPSAHRGRAKIWVSAVGQTPNVRRNALGRLQIRPSTTAAARFRGGDLCDGPGGLDSFRGE